MSAFTSLTARQANAARLARYVPEELTAAANAGRMARFERQVDPDGVLPTAERKRRAQMALKAHMRKLAAKSAKVRAGNQHTYKPR